MAQTAEDRYLQARKNLPTSKSSAEIARDIPPKLRAQSFFSARVVEAHILDRFREITDAYNTGKIGRAEARNLMMEYARKAGKDDGTASLRNLASTGRLNLILDQNAKQAHAVGEYERMEKNKDIFPFVIYHASVGSKQPRSEHKKHDGKVYSKDDPWLRAHWPPSEFGCNCELEECTAKRAEKLGTIQPVTPPDKVHNDSKSGYSFDPAHAFEKFDVSSILDEAKKAEIEKMMKDKVEAIRKAAEEAKRKAEEEAKRKAEEEAKHKAAVQAAEQATAAKKLSLEEAVEKYGIKAKETAEAEALLKEAMQSEAGLKGTEIPNFAAKTKKQIVQELETASSQAKQKYDESHDPADQAAAQAAAETLKTVKAMPAGEVKKQYNKTLAEQAVEAVEAKKKTAILAATAAGKAEKLKLEKKFSGTYVNIWKDPVKVSDYPAKKGAIEAKQSYFQSMLKKHPEDKEKFEGLLTQLAEFDKQGKEYEAALEKTEQAIKQAKEELEEFRKKNGLQEDLFTQEKKDAAYWFKERAAADKVIRGRCGEVWRQATPKERAAIYEYTAGSGKFNRPLSGFAGSWSPNDYKGVGKVDYDYEGGAEEIDYVTDIISKSSYDFDMWLQRGCDADAISNPFGCGNLHKMSNQELQKLVGRSSVIHAFVSTSAAKGSGFSNEVIMNIYAPRGTQMMYCEPFSHYGNGSHAKWNGISGQKSFGGEFEMLIQRGATYKITKVERSGGFIYIDLEIHPEMGYITPPAKKAKKK